MCLFFFAKQKMAYDMRISDGSSDVCSSVLVWALAQGIAQLGPSVDAPEWITRWFLIAAAIGFPFWLAFSWFYEFTPTGLRRESEIDPADSISHSTGRIPDIWILGVLTLPVVLLLKNTVVLHGDDTTTPTTQPVG